MLQQIVFHLSMPNLKKLLFIFFVYLIEELFIFYADYLKRNLGVRDLKLKTRWKLSQKRLLCFALVFFAALHFKTKRRKVLASFFCLLTFLKITFFCSIFASWHFFNIACWFSFFFVKSYNLSQYFFFFSFLFSPFLFFVLSPIFPIRWKTKRSCYCNSEKVSRVEFFASTNPKSLSKHGSKSECILF